MNHALPCDNSGARTDENIFDRYRHKRVLVRADRNYCGRYGYVTATNLAANTAWVSIDGTLDRRIVTIPLEHLICTYVHTFLTAYSPFHAHLAISNPVFCLDDSKPLSTREADAYKLRFATIGELPRPSEDIPRSATPPPPPDDTTCTFRSVTLLLATAVLIFALSCETMDTVLSHPETLRNTYRLL